MNISPGIIIALLMLVQFAFAQEKKLEFSLVTAADGKSLGKINAVTQDSRGFMWLCSSSLHCLFRFDGNRFVTYRRIENDPNSLGMAILETIYADDSGMVWIGGNGLDRYSTKTGNFTHYRHSEKDASSLGTDAIAAILRDHRGRVWVGTGEGLDMLDEKTGRFTHYRSVAGDIKTISCNSVRSLYEDREGRVWVGTGFPFNADQEGGLNLFHEDGTFTRYLHNPGDPHSLIDNKIRAMFEDSRGVFWVGTSGDGLHTMDREKGTFERLLYNPVRPDGLSRSKLNPNVSDHITFIDEDSAGQIWIGTYGGGLNRYDPSIGKLVSYDNCKEFPDSSCWCGFISRDGVLWIATEQSNLLYKTIAPEKRIFSVPTKEAVSKISEDEQGNIWIPTIGDGLYKFDPQYHLLKNYRQIPGDPSALPDNRVSSIYQDPPGKIWIGSYSGIRILNTVSDKFSRFPDKGNFADSTGGFVDIFKDRSGMIWFTRWGGGLTMMNPKDSSFTNFFHSPADSTSISTNEINYIAEDKKGDFWVSGGSGVSRLNYKTGKFRNYLQGVFVPKIFANDQIVLAGSQSGLFIYDSADDRFVKFLDPESGISDDPIGNIIEDNEHNLWLNTFSSLVKLNPVTKEMSIYGARFGVKEQSLLPWGSAYKNSKGQLFYGHEGGFYVFYPSDLEIKRKLDIVVTGFFIDNLPVEKTATGILQQPIEELRKLTLAYDQNNLAFNFAGLDYGDPKATRYFTMLEGYDNNWREVSGEKTSKYFNISPGNYVYRIKGYTIDGIKGEKSIDIHIRPPWWQTWWAYVLYGLIAIAIGVFIYRMQRRRIINAERQKRQAFELTQAKEIEKAYEELKNAQAQLVQSEKMASLGELTAGIAHEIQNPLNFVNNFSEVNKDLLNEMKIEMDKGNYDEAKSIANDVIENEEKINHHGKRAEFIVKGMLQHSRVSTGQKESTDLNALADEYLRLAYHGLRAKDKSFNSQLITNYDPAVGRINIVPQDVGRLLLNLFNNAFYAVGEKKSAYAKASANNNADKPAGASVNSYEPTVSVSTRRIDGRIEIKVRDNGIGIAPKTRDKIFQPFFTTKPTGQGTGLGLSLSYDIIKAHGGEIKVESEEGEYTQFTIELPV